MNKTEINANIIADSKNTFGQRMTTFVIEAPRIILSEINTHRMLSRNSASSRAIPFLKMLDRALQDPFIPIRWMKDHTGMQGNEYFEDPKMIEKITRIWLQARTDAAERANQLNDIGVSKQITNRLLEPFMWHRILITATEFENFFALRAHDQAEIHLQDLAFKMLNAYNESTPKQLQPGDWHVPFGDKLDENRLYEIVKGSHGEQYPLLHDLKVKIGVARCARISYNTFEGKDDYEADLKLHDNLLKNGHLSPFEHIGRCMTEEEYFKHTQGKGYIHSHGKVGDNDTDAVNVTYTDINSFGWSGNLRGFISYRKMVPNENRKDPRVNAK